MFLCFTIFLEFIEIVNTVGAEQGCTDCEMAAQENLSRSNINMRKLLF